jgi:flagellar hook-basal body complex protein FliE
MNDSAAAQVNNLLQGGSGDMNSVMIAVEKADVSFQLMMQVRNKIVSAYQDIEKMQF